jgi:hypothetical protein
MCDECNHPSHEGRCAHDRTIVVDGIEIDGPCGCEAKVSE